MDSFKFKAFARVNGHQPDRVEVQRAARHFAQAAFLREQHEFTHAIEKTRRTGDPGPT